MKYKFNFEASKEKRIKMKSYLLTLALSLCFLAGFGQITQNLRGQILDKESKQPLFGVSVIIVGSQPIKGATSDENGNFTISDVNVGRYTISLQTIGYQYMQLPNIIVNSGKETVLNLEMTESILKVKEVTVVGGKPKGQSNNEMSLVSARQFTIDEANRYAGSLGDPARMAANFAGVSAPSDARNDIIIRGNSPTGLLWRMEGIDIPSPNHFSGQATTGGPVSILNNNTLRNSDFFTGAWPSEYGNSTSGVFDLKMRNGNNNKTEFTGQIGLNGLEAMAEGPIQKSKGSSYMASYRYSVLAVSQKLGFKNNAGAAGVPYYQDFTFKIALPSVKKIGIELFGLGGTSTIDLFDSKRKEGDPSFGGVGKDVTFGSSMGVFGASFMKSTGKNGFIKLIVAQSLEKHAAHVDSLSDNKTQKHDFYNDSTTYNRTHVHLMWNEKFNARTTLRTGVIFTNTNFNLDQRTYQSYGNNTGRWLTLNNGSGNSQLGQFYSQLKYSFTEKLVGTVGIQNQFFFLNNKNSLEPRAGIKYSINSKMSINAGYGLHGQLSPLPLYYYKNQKDEANANIMTNKNLDFYKSHQFVLGYDYNFSSDWRLRIEGYYQLLYNVSVQSLPNQPQGNSISVLNSGADFQFNFYDHLVNTGKGTNKGVEITIEKFFSHNYYILSTTSFYDSKYKGSDGIERNTAFNGKYTSNLLAGKDIILGKKSNYVLTTSAKTSVSGGRWYTPANLEYSKERNNLVLDNTKAYSLQYTSYFRLDVRIGIKQNLKKFTQEFALDLQNITNHQNVLSLGWDGKNQVSKFEYQQGLYPMFLYRIQF